jgi:hypothetical protein
VLYIEYKVRVIINGVLFIFKNGSVGAILTKIAKNGAALEKTGPFF